MFTTCAPPFVCGGGRQAVTLARELAKQGVSVTILTINLDGQGIALIRRLAPTQAQYDEAASLVAGRLPERTNGAASKVVVVSGSSWV